MATFSALRKRLSIDRPALTAGSGRRAEYAVIGGGLVGMAVAFGLARLGKQVTVFDEGDDALRASRGNFGLIWVQGKGAGLTDYARWTRSSVAVWPDLCAQLQEASSVELELDQPGGLDVCLDEAEAEERVARLQGLREALGGDYAFEYVGHNALKELVPAIGPHVHGAVYCPQDGHVNPLYLLRALHEAFARLGGRLINDAPVLGVEPTGGGFEIHAAARHGCEQVVLCAGLGNAKLAPMVGLRAPVGPERGQVLVCERTQPFLRYPGSRIRQVGEGAVQIGDSKEDVGFDDRTTPEVVAALSRRAVQMYPLLRDLRVIRAWGALRVMSPDGCPIYDRSEICPGAFVVNCHSGVTLAGAHALLLSRWIVGDASAIPYEPKSYEPPPVDPRLAPIASLGAKRFDVQAGI
ncbi:MAG: NAD(P)/FAD-dependent oxidoreductase [Gammaproteobacteria bacterium]